LLGINIQIFLNRCNLLSFEIRIKVFVQIPKFTKSFILGINVKIFLNIQNHLFLEVNVKNR
jgi:hypothetical protein